MNDKKIIKKEIKINGKTIQFEIGRFAQQANAAVLGRMGDTIVHATVVCGKERDDIDWFPLQVEYQEKLYAGGKIKGSRWVKREGRPSDEAILTARLIDRSIRPLFPDGFKKEVQVVITVLSVDGENDPDVLALCTASAALSISDIPFEGPVAAVRVGEKEGSFFVNPAYVERDFSNLDLVVAAKKDSLVMVEAGANEVGEEKMVEALEYAFNQVKPVLDAIEKLTKSMGRKKQAFVAPKEDAGLKAKLAKKYASQIKGLVVKSDDERANRERVGDFIDTVFADYPDNSKKEMANLIYAILKEKTRAQILTKGTRGDGRKMDVVRELNINTGVLARTHGSAVFSRGATQALSIVTLGSPSLGQQIESMEGEEEKRYMHHYFFPPYSVGEAGRFGWPSRREVGHGALAERALEPVIPNEDDFPYAIRVVSEIMSSNGSTSMASVCGSTLSLMDAGVPIKKPVAGIAMGLIKDKKSDKYLVLTDITGAEDHIGDMDFKVAGTKDGITALQMDIKIKGVSNKLLKEALQAAKKARLHILEKMLSVLAEPRKKLSQYAPQISLLQIDPEKIGEIIGPGGRMIRQITGETDTMIDVDDDGRVTITGESKDGVARAIDWVEGLTRELQVGEVFEDAEVKRILDFGAFVEVLPGKEGLVHVSRMSTKYIKHPDAVVKVGDRVKVHVSEIDAMKRVNLSMLFDNEGRPVSGPKPQQRSNNRGSRDNRRFDRSQGHSRDRRSKFDRNRRDRKPRY
jgi:polyribonucleotide nucleotidyltransferase